MSYIGNIGLGDTVDDKFTTVTGQGVPVTLGGSPVISNYVGNSTTELTAGITLTVDFDGRTGMHNIRTVATGGNGYATASNYQSVITTGTINGLSAVGYVVSQFSIEARVANITHILGTAISTPATAGVLDVNVKNAGNVAWNSGAIKEATFDTTAGGFWPLGIVDQGTMQSATATTGVIRAAATFGDHVLRSHTVFIYAGTGIGTSQAIIDNVGGTDTFTVDGWEVQPDNTSKYIIYPTPRAPASGTLPIVNSTQLAGQTVVAAAGVTFPASVAGQSIIKNTALASFPFEMSLAGVPVTGLTVTSERSIDGAAYGSTTNSVVEVAHGTYKLSLSAADLNGNTIMFRMSATGADDLQFSITPAKA